jgi:hypothetical protein
VDPHPDFAVPLVQRLVVETSEPRPSGSGNVGGPALALGWYVDPTAGESGEPPVGTLYLVADESLPRPVWVAQARLTRLRVERD